MPGILPMKVIKVGSSSQSRIAQACDRCRSKKIRCDGIRPTCSQCSNVGFECKTSDKLSRRAFPRGYTESLEERVRQLETEVRELKDLLDEKDEKIDMLSKMHGNHARPSISSGPHSPASSHESRKESTPPVKEDTFKVQASPLLLGVENSDSYFMGPSSGRSFIGKSKSFKRRLQESGKSCSEFNPEAFLHIQGCHALTQSPLSDMRVPPRLFSDRCVNVYFQEWAPIFPVLHKPTFLRVYEEFVADPEKIKSNHKIAQLHLVFAIASLSGEDPDLEQVALCEQQWHRAVDAVLMENTMATLQCLVLALMYCTIRADYKRLQHYKGVAVGLSYRLGLHQSQKRFSFGALTIETRKKVFWTLYTLDCLSGAILGLPKHMKEDDIHAEYPSDTDDEYVTEKGFQPTLPGEYTKLSSALALFRLARILGQVMEKNYPAATSHELSLQQMSSMASELDDWQESLPTHLKLTFAQDKPSTDVTGSRSPLLALAYYYTRILIYRPAIGSSLGQKAAPALLSVFESSKAIIQISELLEERGMSFSFCLNKCDVLTLCGLAMLYQCIGLKKESKMTKDAERLVNSVIKTVTKNKSPGWYEFRRVAGMLIHVDEPTLPSPPPSNPDSARPSTSQLPSPPAASNKKRASKPGIGRLQQASASEADLLRQQERIRRMTMPNIDQRPELYRSQSRSSMDIPQANMQRRDQRHSITALETSQNLDFLNMVNNSTNPSRAVSNAEDTYHPSSRACSNAEDSSPVPDEQARIRQQQQALTDALLPHRPGYPQNQNPQKMAGVSTAEWEALLGSLDGGLNNVYDAIYGGPGVSLNDTTPPAPSNIGDWTPDQWEISNFNMGDLNNNPAPAPPSNFSVSEESLSSGEELPVPGELSLSTNSLDYQNAMMAHSNDGYIMEPLENTAYAM